MKRVLIVDDDPEIVELVRNRLEVNNYFVLTASHGREGLNEIKHYLPDLVIMDVMMPYMQGGEVVRMLRSDDTTKYIPVIFLTAIAPGHAQNQESTGINVDGQFYTTIAKPFDSKELLSEINKLIGNK